MRTILIILSIISVALSAITFTRTLPGFENNLNDLKAEIQENTEDISNISEDLLINGDKIVDIIDYLESNNIITAIDGFDISDGEVTMYYFLMNYLTSEDLYSSGFTISDIFYNYYTEIIKQYNIDSNNDDIVDVIARNLILNSQPIYYDISENLKLIFTYAGENASQYIYFSFDGISFESLKINKTDWTIYRETAVLLGVE